MKRYSKQREVILDILRSTTSHPLATDIYIKAREIIPNISLGTVYRNLSDLCKSGEIISFCVDGGGEHFDANPKPHNHLYCRTCKRVIDIDNPYADEFISKSANDLNIEIDYYDLIFYGKCSDCKK